MTAIRDLEGTSTEQLVANMKTKLILKWNRTATSLKLLALMTANKWTPTQACQLAVAYSADAARIQPHYRDMRMCNGGIPRGAATGTGRTEKATAADRSEI